MLNKRFFINFLFTLFEQLLLLLEVSAILFQCLGSEVLQLLQVLCSEVKSNQFSGVGRY